MMMAEKNPLFGGFVVLIEIIDEDEGFAMLILQDGFDMPS